MVRVYVSLCVHEEEICVSGVSPHGVGVSVMIFFRGAPGPRKKTRQALIPIITPAIKNHPFHAFAIRTCVAMDRAMMDEDPWDQRGRHSLELAGADEKARATLRPSASTEAKEALAFDGERQLEKGMAGVSIEMPASRVRCVILGAAGRDFHLFLTCFKDNPHVDVVAFTCTQIPFLERRTIFPFPLSGPLYPGGVPIVPEFELEHLLAGATPHVDKVILAYSDISVDAVDKLRQRVASASPTTAFIPYTDDEAILQKSLLRPRTRAKVLAITGVRTGVGKSQASRYAMKYLTQQEGLKVVSLRHPMPYGNLIEERVQKFSSYEDLERQHVTIEEREEYEPYIAVGLSVYAGVDYQAILDVAESESPDVILFDGGNNDLPFIKPDLYIVVADPFRPGHETTYFPGKFNFTHADVVLINKTDSAPRNGVRGLMQSAHSRNPTASIVVSRSPPTLIREESACHLARHDDRFPEQRPEHIIQKGCHVLCVEDGPSCTHGGMPFGAATFAALEAGACEIVDPRPFLKGSLVDVFNKYEGLGPLLPCMGYSPEQVQDLKETINATICDTVVCGTPIDLRRVLGDGQLNKPLVRVRYELCDVPEDEVKELMSKQPFEQEVTGRFSDILHKFADLVRHDANPQSVPTIQQFIASGGNPL